MIRKEIKMFNTNITLARANGCSCTANREPCGPKHRNPILVGQQSESSYK